MAVDLHLSDAVIDLVANGFDAVLRIAVLEDSSLVARRLCPMAHHIVAAPSYLARHGTPQHPGELAVHHRLGYAYHARGDVWRLRNSTGDVAMVTPSGPFRVTNVDALVPTLLAGLGIAELPDFIAAEHLAAGTLRIVPPDWQLATGGLYFVTPYARSRPAKVQAPGNFLAWELTGLTWCSAPS